MLTGLSEHDKRELASRVGPTVAPVIHDLNKVMARYLSSGDLHGFLFVLESLSVVVSEAFEIAEKIQKAEEAARLH